MISLKNCRKIAIIGNAGAGKTTLSRHLASIYKLPVTHVDSIQFIAGMKIRPHSESIQILNKVQEQDSWIIDGYGPLDILQKRLQIADLIIFIDYPLWRHYWWCTKRQIQNLWSRRSELPEGCNEFNLQHTIKLYKNLWKVHKLMRPELRRILQKDLLKNKVLSIHHLKDLNYYLK